MSGRVLTPLDGTPFGEFALPWATNIARAAGWSLHLVHARVPDPHKVRPGLGGLTSSRPPDPWRLGSRVGYLDAVADRWGLVPGSTAALLADTGVPDAIRRHAEDLGDTRLIVMSTHGRVGLDRLWMGSVSDTLVRSTRIPVLLVRPDRMGEAAPEGVVRRVLVPLDGGELGESILEPLLELGPPLAWSFLLLHAVTPTSGNGEPRRPGRLYETLHRRRLVSGYLERIAHLFRRRGLDVRTRVVESDSWRRAIVRIAQRGETDLIAMATHGTGGLTRAILGSTVDRVLAASSVPMLLSASGVVVVH